MRTLAHLSDLHFGRTDARVVDALLEDLHRHRPDLIIVSGDLTQRARSHQFAEARTFLDRLPAPALVVPGNHDLAPLYRPFSRLFAPRAKFRRHLPGHDPLPVWSDQELLVLGLDSTRSLRWKEGKLRDRHLDHVDDMVADAEAGACKVAFMHHPLASNAFGHPFEALAERGIDLVLTGHVHRVHLEVIHAANRGSCILVQASTACSTRLREDANGYGLIRVDMPGMDITVQGWSGEAFHTVRHQRFVKNTSGLWEPTT
ncbi:MAG: metallophosphoesterase [Pseudomonadota bacterium]